MDLTIGENLFTFLSSRSSAPAVRRKEVKSHWLHLLDFSPVYVFKCFPAPCSCSVKRKDSRRSAKTGHYLQMSFFPPIFASIFLPLSTTILLLYFCEEYFETFLSRILGELSPDVLLPPHLCLDISYKSLFLFHRLSSILFVQNIFRIFLTFLAKGFVSLKTFLPPLCVTYTSGIIQIYSDPTNSGYSARKTTRNMKSWNS